MKKAFLAGVALALSACATHQPPSPEPPRPVPNVAASDYLLLDRVTWGANVQGARELAALGREAWLERQLKPPPGDDLPLDAGEQVAAMTIVQRSAYDLGRELAARRASFNVLADDDKRKMEQQAFQQELTRLARESMTRSMLRALYSPWQLREQMTWFWMNHFNVFAGKAEVRAYLGDYEENAIRANALGRFRDLLGATAKHPAMLRYLDNAQNAAKRLNENYARELMELHTLGVDGGYTQKDVQELARVLTGYGIAEGERLGLRMPMRREVVRDGLYEFDPARHDYGGKVLLGRPLRAQGPAELDEALDRLAEHPSTARFVSRKLALFFVSDDPPPALVERMASTFRRTNGDIAEVLRALFSSPEFTASLGQKFKDPIHYVVSAVRLAYGDKVILNANPVLGWLGRMGEPLYGRQTPDGYPLTRSEWSSAGQMATRFEIARAVGYGAAGLFRTEGEKPVERPAFPQLANALYYQSLQYALGPSTRATLDKASSPQEWNMLLLSSPEFMNR
ncbi:MAG: DUF1800 domain-containing protein [Betaproteobacteria bacterium]|nr:DUF1800 domain-containing protein [Betaproteobacteria bacterium]